MYYTSRMKNVPVEQTYYLLHDTDRPRFVCLVEPGEKRLFRLRGCMCGECTPDWMKSGQYPFQVVRGRFEESLFWGSMPNDFDPATILNEVLVAETAKKLEIEDTTRSVHYCREELARFEANRTEETESTKRRFAHEVSEKTAEVERLLAEIETAKACLANVEEEFEAKRQKLVDDAESVMAELAELQKNVS